MEIWAGVALPVFAGMVDGMAEYQSVVNLFANEVCTRRQTGAT